jgi:glycosyltransferase involved in cell wall biosynthesis
LKNYNIVIVTHVFATGPAQELEKYLKEKVSFLLFIGHPFLYAKDINSFYKIYNKGQFVEKRKAFGWKLPELFMYFKDIFYTIFWIMKFSKKFDLFIGADPLNALSGIVSKILGKVEKVIFYSIDYVPHRFNNKLLNWIYRKIDSFCAERSDFVWNLSERMIRAREEKGVKRKDNQMVVPIGVHSERIKPKDIDQIHRKYLCYMGHLRKGQGLELIIEVLFQIVKKIPDVKLIIIGTGELENYLKEEIEELGLKNYVKFEGYIKDHKEVEDILTTCAVGLALYEPNPNSFTWYADPSKPKQYLACGLPVIITRVPWIAEEIKKRLMGIAINYDKEELANALVRLLNNDEFYNKCRKNAIEFVSRLSWNGIYNGAFRKIGYKIN